MWFGSQPISASSRIGRPQRGVCFELHILQGCGRRTSAGPIRTFNGTVSNVRISSTAWLLERVAQKKMLRDPAGLPVKNVHARARGHPECAVFRFERRAFGQTCRVALVL